MAIQGRSPIWQGEMDGLCGLYAAINACNQLMRLNDDQKEELFATGIDYLDEKKGRLKNTILEGMSQTRLQGVLKRFRDYAKSLDKTLITRKIAEDANNITGLWTLLKKHFSLDSEQRVAIVGLSGYFNHWTCVVKISEKTIHLCDSDGMQRIYKSVCTCGELRAKKRYSLFTGHVIGLSLE